MDIISQEATLKFNLKTRNKWHTFSTFQPKLQEKELRNKKIYLSKLQEIWWTIPFDQPEMRDFVCERIITHVSFDQIQISVTR